MFSVFLLLPSIQFVAALALPLLEVTSPTLIANGVNADPSPLNLTALGLKESSAQALPLASAQSVHSSHVSVLSPPRRASTIFIRLILLLIPLTSSTGITL